MFRAAVNPSMDAAGKTSLFCTPRYMLSRAHLVSISMALSDIALTAPPE
jgi:hypothetical protein